MASIQELNAKVEDLKSVINAEQAQIATVISDLEAIKVALQAQVANGGTSEERQVVLDKLDGAIVDLQSTVPDEPSSSTSTSSSTETP